jgi:hypothetical protein
LQSRAPSMAHKGPSSQSKRLACLYVLSKHVKIVASP